jgi:hypothetical protein
VPSNKSQNMSGKRDNFILSKNRSSIYEVVARAELASPIRKVGPGVRSLLKTNRLIISNFYNPHHNRKSRSFSTLYKRSHILTIR